VRTQGLRFGDGLIGEADADQLAQFEEGRVGDTVEYLDPLSPARDERGIVQDL
jgi:hypothetical protein